MSRFAKIRSVKVVAGRLRASWLTDEPWSLSRHWRDTSANTPKEEREEGSRRAYELQQERTEEMPKRCGAP